MTRAEALRLICSLAAVSEVIADLLRFIAGHNTDPRNLRTLTCTEYPFEHRLAQYLEHRLGDRRFHALSLSAC